MPIQFELPPEVEALARKAAERQCVKFEDFIVTAIIERLPPSDRRIAAGIMYQLSLKESENASDEEVAADEEVQRALEARYSSAQRVVTDVPKSADK